MEGNKNLIGISTSHLPLALPTKHILAFFLVLFSFYSFSQVQFATLKGAPIDTANWKFRGVVTLGTTSGQNQQGSELILCHKSATFSYGMAYYKTPLKINPTCNQWTANFEFRLFDGNSADGLSFFYIQHPENPANDGASLGIPTSTSGVSIVIDTYENCCPAGFNCPSSNNPELQIRTLSVTNDYSECDTTLGTQITNLTSLRSTSYQKMKVEYKNDSLSVFVNNLLQSKLYTPLNLSGYFGFSAANGGSFDTHSIRNVEITIPRTSLTIDAGRDTTVCLGSSLRLGTDSAAGYRYTWTPSTNLNFSNHARPFFNSTIAGMYRLTLQTDSSTAPCFFTDQVTVKVEDKPIFTIHPHDTLICRGQTVMLPQKIVLSNGTITGKIVNWYPKTGIDTTNNYFPKFFPSSTTTYTMQASNKGSTCRSSDTLRVRVDNLPLPTANIGHDTLICENQSITIRTNNSVIGAIYLWSNGQYGNETTISVPGTYWVTSKNANGCVGKSDTLLAGACPPEISTIPNVFTPNNDDKNDTFFVFSQNLDKYKLNIINRWGEYVYSTNDKSAKWEAKNVPDGLYFYHIEYSGLNEYSQTKEKKGLVQVIR